MISLNSNLLERIVVDMMTIQIIATQNLEHFLRNFYLLRKLKPKYFNMDKMLWVVMIMKKTSKIGSEPRLQILIKLTNETIRDLHPCKLQLPALMMKSWWLLHKSKRKKINRAERSVAGKINSKMISMTMMWGY